VKLIYHVDHDLDLSLDIRSHLGNLCRMYRSRQDDAGRADLLKQGDIIHIEGTTPNACGEGQLGITPVNGRKNARVVQDDSRDAPSFEFREALKEVVDLTPAGNGVKGQLNGCPLLASEDEDLFELSGGKLTVCSPSAPPGNAGARTVVP